MATRLPPKAMAKKLVRILRAHHPDYHYLKKVFQHTRELLDMGPAPQAKRLPELLTEGELVAFYEAIWQARQLTHVVMLGRVPEPCKPGQDILSTSAEIPDCIPLQRSLVTSLVETRVRLLTTYCVYEDYFLITTSLRFLRLFRALRV